MLGILLLYFIWKRFADLASQYDRPRRSNGWYGILSYLGGTFFGGIFLAILDVVFELQMDWDNNSLMNLVAIPFGLLGCYFLYVLFEKRWRVATIEIESIDDIGKPFSE